MSTKYCEICGKELTVAAGQDIPYCASCINRSNIKITTNKGEKFMSSKEHQMTIPRMRTITETIAEIKAIDPMTAVTPNCIRTLCKSGKIRCVFTGKKLLVDLDDLFKYFSGSQG